MWVVQCYYLKGAAVCLEQALINYSLQFLMDRDFTALSPPLFMRKEVMQEVSSDSNLHSVSETR
jgi:seryl-tRNA synthetase